MHIYPWQINPHHSSNQAEMSGKPLHQISFTYIIIIIKIIIIIIYLYSTQ